jgi:uncharacterized repeat protein (TIGR03803 family)
MRRYRFLLVSVVILSSGLVMLVAPAVVSAAAYQRLFSFSSAAHAPAGPACLPADGGLYGTTPEGGRFGLGSVFVLRRNAGGAWVSTTLHSFTDDEGTSPKTGVIQARDGNFYGTTEAGGPDGLGTVFKMTPAGVVTMLHAFGAAGGGPYMTGLVQGPDDALYGTTTTPGGTGTTFRITPAGAFTTLAHLSGAGMFSATGTRALALATDGNFYGSIGPALFRMSPDGAITYLHDFGDLDAPATGLVQASNGDLYGITTGFFGAPSSAFKISTSGAYTALRTFSYGEVMRPTGAMVQGPDGYLYGTDVGFGAPANLFRMATDGTLTIVHTFSTAEALPAGGLIVAGGRLIGMTTVPLPLQGGTVGTGVGVAYAATTSGAFGTFFTFPDGPGSSPYGALLPADDGFIYGTTFYGRTAVYRMTADGDVKTFHAFTDAEGTRPWAGLIQGADGDFYGACAVGGTDGAGTIFKMNRSGVLTKVHDFHGADGRAPTGQLLQASNGDIWGTTVSGGAKNCGTAFKITPDGVLTTLYSFASAGAQEGGCAPIAGLTPWADGNFWGTSNGYFPLIPANVYRMTPAGVYQQVFSLTAPENNASNSTFGSLVQGSDGRLYGTSYRDPSPACSHACPGTVFAISLNRTFGFTTLHVFDNSDGSGPGNLVEADGWLYGGTVFGGANNAGTLFRVSKTGEFETLHRFTGKDGANPVSRLLPMPDGSFLGTTSAGGANGVGVLFRFVP